jgi:hypothetical protein
MTTASDTRTSQERLQPVTPQGQCDGTVHPETTLAEAQELALTGELGT